MHSEQSQPKSDTVGLKIEPAHRQTLGVNDISISEEQDAAFETAALWQKPHILEF